ncbi:hypothetical protein [Faecalibacter rhinopitheci]|uniref:Lipoprotein n=1 Tax=Faecalibacter rhinopitheci TaxID=2779678 RepID=A0A8J7FSZ5_9FLAO|nr:hypothetical protein [Faecalibacter rhinopitheci]MBF0598363.1 hypothetical protein [Faecalibacter rhinopitheci]
MNKYSINYILTFLSCLLFIGSCTNDDEINEIVNEKENKILFTFNEVENISHKSSNIDFEYAIKFSYLLQKYDRIHKTNLSGLVNTSNAVKYNKTLKQNLIIESNDVYVETSMFSKLMENSNGDKWIVFPKIKNNTIHSFILGHLSQDKSNLYFYTFDNNSEFYKKNILAFQNAYDLKFKSSTQNRSGNYCDLEVDFECWFEGVIITPNPGGGGGYPGWGGGEGGGGGCAVYEDCEYIEPPTGGGNSSTSNPCEDIKKQTSDPNYKAKIDELNKNSILNKKHESGFSQNKNGSYTSITQTASSNISDGLIVDINSDLKGLIHTHQNSYETGNFDVNGNPEIRQPIKMFSPADVNALMKLALNQSHNSYGDIYVTMVSSSGVYTLKFTGKSSDIKTGFNTSYWTNEYLKFWNNEKGNNETKFLRFLSEKMNVTGVQLLKVDKNGKSQKKSLGSNKKVITDNCP